MSAMLGERIVIANQLSELRRMTQWLHESAAASGVADSAIFLLDFCANEAVVNIISYAYGDKLCHDITLQLHKTGAGARLEIRDDGKPFNPLDAPEHEPPRALDDATIGGLGIHLIRRLLPRCQYRRAGGVNVLSLEV
jgi:anti-sigma regulatory factor (Ser/Thr protein kinase)